MACKCGNLLHCGVLPDYDLVERVAMSADDLIHIFGEHKVADLRPGVDAVHRL